jgi:tetratricopeptide (TPR) repeat protein
VPSGPSELPGEMPVEEPLSPPIERTTALRRAAQHNQDGFALAAKGAWYSARSEFQSALELVVAAADGMEGTSARSRAVREAQTALREAVDFVPHSGTRSGRIDVAHLVAGHQSKVIEPQTAGSWSSVAAHEAYLAFARRRLADAGAGQRAASVALHGLGKVHAAMEGDDRDAVDGRKKARAFYEAALEVGPDNFIAVNDLAVLLAEEGDLERGRAALESGLRISRQPAMLQNLAVVYGRMGQPQAAEQLRAEAASLERHAAAGTGELLPTYDVRWMDPRAFASTARGGADPGRTPPPAPMATGSFPNGPLPGYASPAPMQPTSANPYINSPTVTAPANRQPMAAGGPAGRQVPSTAVRPVRNALVY